MEEIEYIYNILNEQVLKLEKDEPHFYVALIKLGLKLEKYDEIYPLLFQFDSKAEFLSNYVAQLQEFIADEGYQGWVSSTDR